MKHLSANVLMKLAPVALFVFAALAVGRDAAPASGSGSLWLMAESALQNTNAADSAQTVLAFDAFRAT